MKKNKNKQVNISTEENEEKINDCATVSETSEAQGNNTAETSQEVSVESQSLDFFEGQAVAVVNNGLNPKTGGIAYSLLLILYCVLSLLLSLVAFLIARFGVMPKQGFTELADAINYVQGRDWFIYSSYLVAPIMIAACVLIIARSRKVSFGQVFPVKCKPQYYLYAILLIFGLLFSLSWVNTLSLKFFKLFGYRPKENYLPSLSGWRVAPALLVIAVLPAFFEELMFRGLILNCNNNGMGSIRAILVTGFCFSLFHASPEQTIYQFIAGCAFALLAVRSGSILPSILMHFINNAIIVIFGACNLFDEAGELIISNAANITVTVLSAVAFVAAIVLLILDKTELKKKERGGVISFFLYGSVGIGALSLIWLLSLFGVA